MDTSGLRRPDPGVGPTGRYRDPDTGYPLPTWAQALADARRRPGSAAGTRHARSGGQVDIKGILGGSRDSDRAVRYLTKYLTKSVAETYADEDDTRRRVRGPHRPAARPDPLAALLTGMRQLAALRRRTEEPRPRPGPRPLRLQGPRPRTPRPRRPPGPGLPRLVRQDPHQHKADRAAVVEQVLTPPASQPDDADRMAAETLTEDGRPRFIWDEVPVTQGDWARVVMDSIREHDRRRDQYEQAKAIVAGTDPPVDSHSATKHSSSDQAA